MLAEVIEMVYYCINSRTILPNHFLETLLCYSMTNCKTYLNFISSRSPGGGYSYITNWLKEQNIVEKPFPKGLVKSVFDNNQKVGKTYLISERNIVPTSVITSHLYITLDSECQMEEDVNFEPDKWM